MKFSTATLLLAAIPLAIAFALIQRAYDSGSEYLHVFALVVACVCAVVAIVSSGRWRIFGTVYSVCSGTMLHFRPLPGFATNWIVSKVQTEVPVRTLEEAVDETFHPMIAVGLAQIIAGIVIPLYAAGFTAWSGSYAVWSFAIATCFGAIAFLAMDVGLIGWVWPTFVSAIASLPLGLLCRFTIWKTCSVYHAFVLRVLGGLIFGFLALQIDRWIDNAHSLMGQNSIGMSHPVQIFASMVLAGMVSMSAQYVIASAWKRRFQHTMCDEPSDARESPS